MALKSSLIRITVTPSSLQKLCASRVGKRSNAPSSVIAPTAISTLRGIA